MLSRPSRRKRAASSSDQALGTVRGGASNTSATATSALNWGNGLASQTRRITAAIKLFVVPMWAISAPPGTAEPLPSTVRIPGGRGLS